MALRTGGMDGVQSPGRRPQSAVEVYDQITRFLPSDSRARNAESLSRGRRIVDLISPFLEMALEP